ncbi:ATP-binding protein [Nonomuraea sp. NPDC049158]|uniref:AlbA family DNA-binding domain-containing protein n=1 Tax=Nonomuraea sp. NPDC049158 TaxID=3155649 RepID=UPI0033C2C310
MTFNDVAISLWTADDREFELSSNQAPSVPLKALRDGIHEYIVSLATLNPTSSLQTNTRDSYSFTLCIDDASPLAWESTNPMIFIDFSATDEFQAEFSVRSPREIPQRAMSSRFAAILNEYGCSIYEKDKAVRLVDVHKSNDPGLYIWSVEAIFPSSTTITQACTIRRELNYSSFFFSHSLTDPRMVYELVRGGGVARLLGVAENEWLEVKSAPYEMKRDKQWQCELSEDVARFANSEYGGILLVGIRSEKQDGRDVLSRLSPLPIDGKRVERYHQSIDSHVHPPIDRLKIENISMEGGEMVCILIPPQPEERKPFLVQGAFIDGKYQQGTISIVRRRGEHSIPVTAREIHAMLAAGRALLRREADSSHERPK